MTKSNMNLEIEDEVIARSKAKANILGITFTEFVERVLDNNTQDIAKVNIKELK